MQSVARAACITAALFSSGCYRTVTGGWWANGDHYYSTTDYPSAWDGHEVDVVRDQAERDFACPGKVVAVRGNARVWIAEGCGHRAPYLVIALMSTGMVQPPGRSESAYVTWVRAINLASPTAPAPVPSGIETRNDPTQLAKPWIDLVTQGALDLDCPATQITPDYVPQGRAPAIPVAEGCGKRATYLSEAEPRVLRLSSLVPMK